ncbi:MAG TPA: ATP synthase F0 subunit B [Acidobacteriaceae bacterium]|jgi:F-type H+-transporting ATPase subunit b|nr:ATP synthase F0 subunit B [Acidobacteriaceae bacterium]
MDILRQLGGLLLGAVPTAIFFILLVVAYGFLVRRPLARTLAERRARTSGAVEQARGAIAAAEAETSVYEGKLRAARAQILAMREEQLKRLQAEREAALEGARQQAQERVRMARAEIESSTAAAREQIERASVQLSDQILRAILPAGAPMAEAGR